MRIIWFTILLLWTIEANQQPYKKEIDIEKVSNPTLVQVALDNEIYNNTEPNYADIRLHSSQGVEGYFIKPFQLKKSLNQQRLRAKSYDRENATLTYVFKEPFDVEKIELNIEDRNFESRVDVYIDNALVVKNSKIFDYSNETGNRNFSISIPKTKAKELKIVYSLDNTTSFYKKYQNLRERSQYLSIKSATFLNFNKRRAIFDKTTVPLERELLKDKKSSYIFKTDATPFSKIEIIPIEQNFKRDGVIYSSDDALKWRYLKSFSISSSTISDEVQKVIPVNQRSRHIKLEINNYDNKPLSINKIELWTTPNYLYFIANPNENYSLYFGQKNLKKPLYGLENLVNNNTKYIKGKFSKLKKLKVDSIERNISFIEKYKELFFIAIIILALAIMSYIAFGLLKEKER